MSVLAIDCQADDFGEWLEISCRTCRWSYSPVGEEVTSDLIAKLAAEHECQP